MIPGACARIRHWPTGRRRSSQHDACIAAALEWDKLHAPSVRIDISSPNPAFAPLLNTGFRIIYMHMFCSNSVDPCADPERYVLALSELC